MVTGVAAELARQVEVLPDTASRWLRGTAKPRKDTWALLLEVHAGVTNKARSEISTSLADAIEADESSMASSVSRAAFLSPGPTVTTETPGNRDDIWMFVRWIA